MAKEERLDFTVPAIRLHQRENSDKSIYLTKISASKFGKRFDERFRIAFYKHVPNGDDIGYQRQLNDRAIDKIKDYVLAETNTPMLPTAILANSRGKLDFKEISSGFGELTINSELFIIDGQHRLKAWKSMMSEDQLKKKYGDFEFPFIILSGFDEFEEVEQFYVINSRQKKIKTDLAQRHLLELAKHRQTENLVPQSARWQLYATKIVDILNEKIDGPWKNRIELPSDSKDIRRTKMISQNSFISSLKPLFVGKDAYFPIDPQPNGQQIEEWANFIANFWKIIALTYPEIVDHPSDYSLMKTVGVFSLHLFLAKELNRIKGSEREAMKKISDTLFTAAQGDFGTLFWRTKVPQYIKDNGRYAGAFSSAVGHNRIAAGLMLGSQVQ